MRDYSYVASNRWSQFGWINSQIQVLTPVTFENPTYKVLFPHVMNLFAAYSIPETLTDRHFVVSQPFLYFVVDKESLVTLVGGIMMDPTKQNIRFL